MASDAYGRAQKTPPRFCTAQRSFHRRTSSELPRLLATEAHVKVGKTMRNFRFPLMRAKMAFSATCTVACTGIGLRRRSLRVSIAFQTDDLGIPANAGLSRCEQERPFKHFLSDTFLRRGMKTRSHVKSGMPYLLRWRAESEST